VIFKVCAYRSVSNIRVEFFGMGAHYLGVLTLTDEQWQAFKKILGSGAVNAMMQDIHIDMHDFTT
jgi:Spy/CpxP family protein refolding chaperone